MGIVIGIIIWGVIWGVATNKVIENKGYDENWFWWGFIFGFIALIVAAAKPEVRSSTPVPSSSASTSTPQQLTSIDQKTLANGGWKCTCGRVNPSYTGTCSCGKKKRDIEEEQHLEQLKKLKDYKELLDSGVISSEEYEKKKKELLG